MERREAPATGDSVPEDPAEIPTMAKISAVTANLPKGNYIHDIDGTHHSDDVSLYLVWREVIVVTWKEFRLNLLVENIP